MQIKAGVKDVGKRIKKKTSPFRFLAFVKSIVLMLRHMEASSSTQRLLTQTETHHHLLLSDCDTEREKYIVYAILDFDIDKLWDESTRRSNKKLLQRNLTGGN